MRFHNDNNNNYWSRQNNWTGATEIITFVSADSSVYNLYICINVCVGIYIDMYIYIESFSQEFIFPFLFPFFLPPPELFSQPVATTGRKTRDNYVIIIDNNIYWDYNCVELQVSTTLTDSTRRRRPTHERNNSAHRSRWSGGKITSANFPIRTAGGGGKNKHLYIH